jgi:hypothetical protein
MISIKCNIEKSDRINRIVLGVLVLLGLLFGMGKFFFSVLGIVMIVEGAIGWCGIPVVIDKLKQLNLLK